MVEFGIKEFCLCNRNNSNGEQIVLDIQADNPPIKKSVNIGIYIYIFLYKLKNI